MLGVLLHESINVAGDRMVVVSQSTSALDLVQASQPPTGVGGGQPVGHTRALR